MSNDININESAILETLNAKIDYDGGNYKGSGLANYVVDKSGDSMSGPLKCKVTKQYSDPIQLISSEIDFATAPSRNTNVGIHFYDKNNKVGPYLILQQNADSTQNYLGIGNNATNNPNFLGFNLPKATSRATTTSTASAYKPAVVTQNYKSGKSWYRVWSDGWIEQGGYYDSLPSNTTISIAFLKAFVDTNYNFRAYQYHSGGTGDSWNENDWISALTTSKITIYNSRAAGGGIFWHACGY